MLRSISTGDAKVFTEERSPLAFGRNHSPPKKPVSFREALRYVFAILLAVPLFYLLAAVLGSLVPRNSDWQEPPQGTLIFVRSNGVHVDLVLPASAAGIDLYRLVPPQDIADPGAARGWVVIGWGQR